MAEEERVFPVDPSPVGLAVKAASLGGALGQWRARPRDPGIGEERARQQVPRPSYPLISAWHSWVLMTQHRREVSRPLAAPGPGLAYSLRLLLCRETKTPPPFFIFFYF